MTSCESTHAARLGVRKSVSVLARVASSAAIAAASSRTGTTMPVSISGRSASRPRSSAARAAGRGLEIISSAARSVTR
jgi:hypothetical protein